MSSSSRCREGKGSISKPTLLILVNLGGLRHSVIGAGVGRLINALHPGGCRQLLLRSRAVVPGRRDCSTKSQDSSNMRCWYEKTLLPTAMLPAATVHVGCPTKGLLAGNNSPAAGSPGPSSSSSACLPLLFTAGAALRQIVPCMRCSGCFQRLRAATGMRSPAHSPAAVAAAAAASSFSGDGWQGCQPRQAGEAAAPQVAAAQQSQLSKQAAQGRCEQAPLTPAANPALRAEPL